MAPRGKVVALEGIDGAGKRTQVELLGRALDERGVSHFEVSFPRYKSFFGQAVTRYLTGDFGRLDEVDPHFSALLYAGDRLEAKGEIEAGLDAGRLLLADRYIASNLAHQGARVGPEQREEFLAWVRRLEYEIFALPKEDLIIYLRVPVEESARRTAARGKRLTRDIQESDLRHLESAASVYEELARGPEWAVIDGFDPATKQPRPPEEIHREILGVIEGRLILVTHGSD